jgi:CDGSH-type Zn-finger protein
MPEHQHSSTMLKGKHRTKVILQRGEVISLCRCWQSKKFPLCDGAHKTIDNSWGPVMVFADCEHDFHDEE